MDLLSDAPLPLVGEIGFAPVRKTRNYHVKWFPADYEKECRGIDTLTMHADAIKPGQRVLIIDDVSWQQVELLKGKQQVRWLKDLSGVL